MEEVVGSEMNKRTIIFPLSIRKPILRFSPSSSFLRRVKFKKNLNLAREQKSLATPDIKSRRKLRHFRVVKYACKAWPEVLISVHQGNSTWRVGSAAAGPFGHTRHQTDDDLLLVDLGHQGAATVTLQTVCKCQFKLFLTLFLVIKSHVLLSYIFED